MWFFVHHLLARLSSWWYRLVLSGTWWYLLDTWWYRLAWLGLKNELIKNLEKKVRVDLPVMVVGR